MNYSLFKLTFTAGVHFGTGTLDSTEAVFRSDSLFSALFVEALKSGTDTAERFKSFLENGDLVFSDALPFKEEKLFLPKPCLYIDRKADNSLDASILNKQSKKLRYVDCDSYRGFFKGDSDIRAQLELTQDLGTVSVRTSAVIDREEGTTPYQVGVYSYRPDCGLFVIVGHESRDAIGMFEELLRGLSFSGFGGRRSAGLGRFTAVKADIPQSLNTLLCCEKGVSVLISTAFPKAEELESSLCGAEYTVIKRGGFVGSYNEYLNSIRKRDAFMFEAGSCFKNRFTGAIINVSRNEAQPVYRSAAATWIGVDV